MPKSDSIATCVELLKRFPILRLSTPHSKAQQDSLVVSAGHVVSA